MWDSSKYTEYGKKVPKYLALIGPVVLLFAVYYFIRLFYQFSRAFDYFSAWDTLLCLLYMLVLFVLYLNFLLTAFWLTSGNRRAWARMMRMTILYLVILVLSEAGLRSLNGDIFNIGPFLMFVVLVSAMAFMMTKPVRDFYTPTYACTLPLKDWIPYILWVDPFHCNAIEME
jgi:hypothetical protein